MLVSELAVAEMNDDNQRDLDPLSGGRYPRQHPVHLDRMGEAHATISSTSWSVPMVRDSGVISISGGIFGMKCVA